jgi:hypothetical protein
MRRRPAKTDDNTCAACGDMNQRPDVQFCGHDGNECEWRPSSAPACLFDDALDE